MTIHISVPADVRRRLRGITCHRRANLEHWEVGEIDGIQVTCPATTIVDIAPGISFAALDRATNDADKLDLINPEELRRQLDRMPRRPGKARVRELLDRHTFLLTDSELERRFIPIARRAGLPTPVTGAHVNGFKVDFYWPDLGLVVEVRYEPSRVEETLRAVARSSTSRTSTASAGSTGGSPSPRRVASKRR